MSVDSTLDNEILAYRVAYCPQSVPAVAWDWIVSQLENGPANEAMELQTVPDTRRQGERPKEAPIGVGSLGPPAPSSSALPSPNCVIRLRPEKCLLVVLDVLHAHP